MNLQEEPMLGSESDTPHQKGEVDPALPDRIRWLMNDQPYAVLCTQGQTQPYGSLVAFAVSKDMRSVVFGTPITTRKYRLLVGCDHVALVVDSRSSFPDDMMKVEAVTATGRAVELKRGEAFTEWADKLTHRHPNLQAFVAASSCALFRIDIIRYFHVGRFQEVQQWVPPDSG